MKLFGPTAVWLKFFKRPYLQKIHHRENVGAVQIEGPKVAAVAANLIAHILLESYNDLHFVLDSTPLHLSDTKHSNSWLVTNLQKLVLMATSFRR